MRPVKTEKTTIIFTLPGGSSKNDLPVQRVGVNNGNPMLISTWEFNEEEIEQIAAGKRIQLIIHGSIHPPVSLCIEDDDA